MAAQNLSWKFPQKEFLVLRIEALFVGILAVFIFVASLYQFNKEVPVAVGFAILFLAIYALLSYLIQQWRQVEEHYKLTKKHLEVVRKKRGVTKKEKSSLKDIAHHKLDKTFLGGYLLTRKGKKHLLFFNTKEEVEKFERFLKRHLKK